MGVLVVGGSVAGVRVATALREAGYAGQVTVLDREPGPPYDKPSLSKETLTDGTAPPALPGHVTLEEIAVEHRPGVEATSLDLAGSTVETSAGPVAFDRLVVATGSQPRGFPLLDDLANVHVLRTARDAARLGNAWVRPGSRVTVLGGGFIGCEVAAGARKNGLDVTVVEATPTILARSLTREEAERMTALHRAAGVKVLTDSPVADADVETDPAPGRVRALVLGDGTRVETDLVLVGIGSVPVVDWLGTSGLEVAGGLRGDGRLRVSGDGRVLAVGDVVRWPNARYGREMRLEHWTSAREQAAYVARLIVDDPKVRDSDCGLLPYVWSDQHGHRLQLVGDPDLAGAESITVPGVEPGWVHLRVRDGLVVAAAALDAQWHVARLRRLLASCDARVDAVLATLVRRATVDP
ncbi:NAD(P)/FAD-dependent oxidoreductase [Qaidamihabitans albus]|uniref:NAD(P)/FAD-dependent oxidoreductase n=1 Tax=Qaidamihabitans albus TaxID=2795733 RepID=UPI0018F1F76F|nr:FAD/NAD(P)-binding oxidoreductase [Qaidamihabitans albus]